MENYQALFEPAAEGGFVVTLPDFEFGTTQGDDEMEAMVMASDALTTVITAYIEKGKPLPEPTQRRGKKYRAIPLPALQSAKVELYRSFASSGLRKAEFARRAGISKTNVDRLFDLEYGTGIDQLENAFRALGKRLALQISDAA